jgi:polyphosphate kinase
MSKDLLKSTELYINRELSWLEFNDRVLREGLNEELPLLERMKFLAIVSSNLDEFFLVRVAGLMQARAAGVRRRDPSGLTPAQQLTAISERVHRMIDEQAEGILRARAELAEQGLRVYEPDEWDEEQRRYLAGYFTKEILPVLTPLAIQELEPSPLLPNLQLHLAAVLAAALGQGELQDERIVVVPVPTQFPRLVGLPAEQGVHLARLEDVIAANLGALFVGREVLATAAFRITRDADVLVQDDETADLLQSIEEAVRNRRRRVAVRLTLSARPDRRIRKWLADWLELRPDEVYELPTANDAALLMELANWPGFEQLRVDAWAPQTARDLLGADDLWTAVKDHDVLLFHPYESFDPVVKLLEQAAADPQVLAIKQTLYRTSGNSPIVRALQQAGENGKEVTVLVELRARFDEARNVGWARRLEDAGCHVIYGIVGLKTHAKALLIVRREGQRIQRYVHLATGNYNDRTARLYSDLGLLTADRDMANDVSAFFNLLTGYSESVGWSKISIAPTGLKQRIIDLVEREIQVSTPDRPGLIMAKTNSLQEPEVIRALYRASQAGVRVLLNVRGICCLRPGVTGVSDLIEVRSIVDRFLEHARIYYFRNGGHEEVYLSSADLMRRNLSKRLEILFPLIDAGLRRRCITVLETFFADNVKARILHPDGVYRPVERDGPKVRAQEKFYRDALGHARAAAKTEMQFRPLERPAE